MGWQYLTVVKQVVNNLFLTFNGAAHMLYACSCFMLAVFLYAIPGLPSSASYCLQNQQQHFNNLPLQSLPQSMVSLFICCYFTIHIYLLSLHLKK